MGFAALEDATGLFDVFLAPEVHARLGQLFQGIGPYRLRGRLACQWGSPPPSWRTRRGWTCRNSRADSRGVCSKFGRNMVSRDSVVHGVCKLAVEGVLRPVAAPANS
jgi:hypothetical protein